MLRSINEMRGYGIQATDGPIGDVHDFYFDDSSWRVRYVVVDCGTWLTNRKVLISPVAFDKADWNTSTFPVRLTKEQVKNSPDFDLDRPVSRLFESEISQYYGWPAYWGGIMTPASVAPAGAPAIQTQRRSAVAEEDAESNLRSAREVVGYSINAMDGDIGHVEDFIVEDDDWLVRYMIVDTRNWLPGRKVIVSPDWIERVSWKDRKVLVELTRDGIKNSPEFDASLPVNREYEMRLYDFHGKPTYWG